MKASRFTLGELLNFGFTVDTITGTVLREGKPIKPYPTPAGYLAIRIYTKRGQYRAIGAHRLIWILWHKRWPIGTIDHINLNPADNRLCNLREATQSQNSANKRSMRSGLKGAYWSRVDKRWSSSIKIKGRVLHLGSFGTEQEAHDAYMLAATEHFGEFARAA